MMNYDAMSQELNKLEGYLADQLIRATVEARGNMGRPSLRTRDYIAELKTKIQRLQAQLNS